MNTDEVQYLRDQIEDHTYQVHLWPNSFREMLISSHLNYSQRFQLTIFLLGNRLDPRTIGEWYKMRGMLRDDAARTHVADLFRSHAHGDLEKYDAYVMNATDKSGNPAVQYMFDNGHIICKGERQPLIAPAFSLWTNSEWEQAYRAMHPRPRRIF